MGGSTGGSSVARTQGHVLTRHISWPFAKIRFLNGLFILTLLEGTIHLATPAPQNWDTCSHSIMRSRVKALGIKALSVPHTYRPRTHHPPHDSCPHCLGIHFRDVRCMFLFDIQQQHNSNQPDELHLENRAKHSSHGLKKKFENRSKYPKGEVVSKRADSIHGSPSPP